MRKGQKASEEQRRKNSESHKGQPAWNKGKRMSDEQKAKISKAKKGKPSPNKGKKMSEATKTKLSKALKGRPAHNKGKPMSDGQKAKLSEAWKDRTVSEETKQKMSKAWKGKPKSEEHKQKVSATKQNIPYDEWETFACEKKYCPKFDESCRESNREKYGRRCFICNKSEKANGQKLSVHHVDMKKAQGCESNWKLVPLCKHCHATAHNDEIIARLGYLMEMV